MRALVFLLSATLFLTILGCGDDDSPTNPQNEESAPSTAAPELFFAAYEKAFNDGDFEAIRALYHEDYEFHNLPDNPDDPDNYEIWDLRTELDILRHMFSGDENPSGVSVLGIQYEIQLQEITTDTSDHGGVAPGEIWYDIRSEIDLLVVTQDPSSSDGSGIINRVVNSNQDYTLRPGPEQEGNLLLYRQYDREPVTGKSVRPGAVSRDKSFIPGFIDDASWGEVKSLFRYAAFETGIAQLLDDRFEDAYVRGDSAGYAALLDVRYEFENLPDDPGEPTYVEIWTREDEMRIAGRMFSGWENPSGIFVLDIALDQVVQGMRPTYAFFSDKPSQEAWYKVLTEVDLIVVTRDRHANDGSGILNRVVFSKQDYVVRPAPNDLDGWLIRRQVDREAITGKGSAGTENSNWGGIKELFR